MLSSQISWQHLGSLNPGGKNIFVRYFTFTPTVTHARVASKRLPCATYTPAFSVFLPIWRHSSWARQKLLSIGSTGCLRSLLMQSKTQSSENGSISNVPLLWQCQTGNGIWKTKPSERERERERERRRQGSVQDFPGNDGEGNRGMPVWTNWFIFPVLGALRGSSISQSSSPYKRFSPNPRNKNIIVQKLLTIFFNYS